MDGTEQSWNTNENIQTDQYDPFDTPRMSQIWPYGDQRGAKKGYNYPIGLTNQTIGPIFGWKGRDEVVTPMKTSKQTN